MNTRLPKLKGTYYQMRPNINPHMPGSDDYKVSFEEYKLLLEWTNKLADRRQETNNLFFGVTGAILTVISLALTQLKSGERLLGVILATVVGIIVSLVWASLLQRYQEILRFKYTQLELFEEILGLDSCGLVSAEDKFFRSGKPLEAYGKSKNITTPSKIGRFGVTLAERNLSLILLGVFIIILIIIIVANLF